MEGFFAKMSQHPITLLLGFSLLITSCATPPAPRPQGGPEPTDPCVEWIVDVLASDKIKRLEVGAEGAEGTMLFLEKEFRALGLKPWQEGYRQPFQAVSRVQFGAENSLKISGIPGRVGSEFMPLSFSPAGVFSGSLVFAGYGIRAEPLGYDDYEGIDARGKVVLALRYEPGPSDPASPFDGDRPSRWSDLRSKARWAQEAGAQALVLIDLPGERESERPLPLFRQHGSLLRAELPVLQVNGKLLLHLLGRYGHDLNALRAAIDQEYKPHSVELPAIKLSGKVDIVTTEIAMNNILGVFPGRGELADEVVVVATNLELLGLEGAKSSHPKGSEIHQEADDNASGVAAMVCGTAGAVTHFENRSSSHRSLVLATFSGEELVHAGSQYYSQNPRFPLTKTVAMLNLYRVGGLPGGPATIDFAGKEEIASSVSELLTELLSQPDAPADPGSTQPSFQVGDHRATAGRAHLGTVPDVTRISEPTGGVLLASTIPGSPAAEAGLRAGDRIVQMAGIPTPNIGVFTRVLLDHSVGERTEIVVRRGELLLHFWVTLKLREGLSPLR